MKITFPMILERLSNVNIQYFPSIASETKYISNVKFLKNSLLSTEPDILYLANLSFLTSAYKGPIPQNIVCIKDIDIDVERKRFRGSNIILVEDSIEATDFFDLLQDSFSYYSSILNDLLEIVEENKGLQFLADRLMTVFQNPVSFINRNLDILAYSSKYKQKAAKKENYLRFYEEISLRGNKWETDKENNFLMESYLQRMNLSDTPVSFDASEGYEFSMISYNLKVHNKYVGIFTVFAVDHPFTIATGDLILFISGIISLELQKDKLLLLNDGMKYEYFYIDLLKGKSLSDHDVNKILNHLNYSEENHYFLMVINSPVLSNYSYELTYLKSKILTFIKTDFCVIYEGNIVLVVESSSESFLTDLAFSKFKELLSISYMFAGISRPFHTLEDVKRGYSEAKKAVELGLKMNIEGRIFEYKDFQFYHLLDLCANQEEVRNLCHPALLDLIEHHYELSTTLYLYLKNGKSQAKTAKELHIQRSSLLYRLRRIEEVLDLKLDDYQSLLHIQLSYEILNYLNFEHRQLLNPSHAGLSAQGK